ncbi:MAG: DUF1345 domain-containing protein [Pseudolabrys sp.]|nr:DUF1345 domain-containing protein [Pseudolabrys sp.]MBV9954426.1 DUF1345 domain-containing protein [Pseudolabrys sp.]
MFPIRFARLHGRLLSSFAVGVATTLLIVAYSDWRMPARILAGWDVFVVLYLALIGQVMMTCNVERIRARAAEEDEGALTLLLLSAVSACAALIAVVAVLGNLKNAPNADGHVIVAVATIVLSWLFVHTIFALHYAHEYYGDGRDRQTGGLEFPGRAAPDYWDFMYFSLIIAMTSQVSDVQISSKAIRRVAAAHGVLAFFFNLGILALTINIVSNLL